MEKLLIVSGAYRFEARLETQAAPKTCAVFRKLLPYENKIIHVRWSGEAVGFRLANSISG